jgi:hypothetical protein
MAFDPRKDEIALVMKSFTLLKPREGLFGRGWFDRYSEPYVVAVAVDAKGEPAIDVQTQAFAGVGRGDTIRFDGQGLLLYGPENPGDFLAWEILIMESDKRSRRRGAQIQEILDHEATDMGLKALMAANRSAAAAAQLLKGLVDLLGGQLQQDKDELLMRRQGTLLFDACPPFELKRTYLRENDFVASEISVIAMRSDEEHLGCRPAKRKM